MFENLIKKIMGWKDFGDWIVFTKDTPTFGCFGDVDIVPKGTIGINRGYPSGYECPKGNIEIKLLNPMKNGIFKTDRIVMKRNSKFIETLPVTMTQIEEYKDEGRSYNAKHIIVSIDRCSLAKHILFVWSKEENNPSWLNLSEQDYSLEETREYAKHDGEFTIIYDASLEEE